MVRVYIGDNSYKSFAVKDKTRISDLLPQILEKFEIPAELWEKFSVYEQKGETGMRGYFTLSALDLL